MAGGSVEPVLRRRADGCMPTLEMGDIALNDADQTAIDDTEKKEMEDK